MFSNGAYVDVWHVKPVTDKNGNVISGAADVSITSSRRNDDGTYTKEFGDIVRFYNTKGGGTAATDLLALESKGDKQKLARIKLGNVAVKNSVVKQGDGSFKRYYNFYCWGFDFADTPPQSSAPATQASSFMEIPDSNSEELPFI